MRSIDIEVGEEYIAYAGSLARVRVHETHVPFELYDRQVKRMGVRVEALKDVPLAIDLKAARRSGRPPRLARRAGDVFVIPSKDVVRKADR